MAPPPGGVAQASLSSSNAPLKTTPASGVTAAAPRVAVRTDEGTVREEVPPWHVLQERFTARAATVRAKPGAANDTSALTDVLESLRSDEPPVRDIPLSFKVYTLDDLERRGDAASRPGTQSKLDKTPRGWAHWQRAFEALAALGSASLVWWKTKGERPAATIALRGPWNGLAQELRALARSIDWRKYGVATGIALGASLTLLFAVLVAAELTDDIKPAAHMASTELESAAPDVLAPASPSAAEVTSAGELDDGEPAAPAKRAAARRNTTKPKASKLTFRNADSIFTR